LVEKEITIEIKNPEIILLLALLGVVLIGFPPFVDIFYTLPDFLNWLRIPGELSVTFNNPIVFGDEGFHARMGQWIAENVEYPVWIYFSQTKLNYYNFGRVPYWNLLIAGFLYLFGPHEAFIRFLPPFITFLTGLAVFLLGRELYNRKVGFIASIITITIPSFVTYSALIYTDVLVTFFLTMFFLLFTLSIKRGKKIYLYLSGIFGAFAFLTKTSGFAAYIFIFLVFIYELIEKRKIYEPFKKYFILFLILIIIPSTFFLRSYFYYKTPICAFPFIDRFFDTSGCSIKNYEKKYEFAGRTEEVGTEQSVYRMGIMNYLIFAYGNVWFVFFASISGLFLFLYRKDKFDIFVLFMLLIFLILFINQAPGRAEDTARYTLVWAPFIGLVAAKWFEEVYNFIKRYQKYLALVVFIFIIVLSYQNLKGKLDVMASVKQFSPSFFEACDWVKENLPEDVMISTVWTSRAVYNCQRTVVGHNSEVFLSRDIDYTKEMARKFGITHLFIQKFSLSDQSLSEKYNIESIQFFENHPETFKKVYENGPTLQQCLQQGGCDGNIIYEIVY